MVPGPGPRAAVTVQSDSEPQWDCGAARALCDSESRLPLVPWAATRHGRPPPRDRGGPVWHCQWQLCTQPHSGWQETRGQRPRHRDRRQLACLRPRERPLSQVGTATMGPRPTALTASPPPSGSLSLSGSRGNGRVPVCHARPGGVWSAAGGLRLGVLRRRRKGAMAGPAGGDSRGPGAMRAWRMRAQCHGTRPLTPH